MVERDVGVGQNTKSIYENGDGNTVISSSKHFWNFELQCFYLSKNLKCLFERWKEWCLTENCRSLLCAINLVVITFSFLSGECWQEGNTGFLISQKPGMRPGNWGFPTGSFGSCKSGRGMQVAGVCVHELMVVPDTCVHTVAEKKSQGCLTLDWGTGEGEADAFLFTSRKASWMVCWGWPSPTVWGYGWRLKGWGITERSLADCAIPGYKI